MEGTLFLWIGIFAAAFVSAMVIAIVIYAKGLKTRNTLLKSLDHVERQLELRKAKEEEYKALTAQVEELGQLRDNLEAQVALNQNHLNQTLTDRAVAEVQINSANTHFTEIQEKVKAATARLTEIEEIVKKKEEAVDGEVDAHRKKLEAELQAQLEQKRAEATEGLVRELNDLRQAYEAERQAKIAVAMEYEALMHDYNELQGKVDSLAKLHGEAVKRAALENGTGGTIHLEQADRADVEMIRKVARGMRCENAVLKATYDVYVKPEIERLVRDQGVTGVSGIYRIWRKEGERELSYIGQAVDVGERWKTHAKRAWGVDNTGRIKLYQAMMESGIEGWNWELVEACEAVALSEREKYWGGFYSVKEVGLNNKLG